MSIAIAILKELKNLGHSYKILDEHEFSRVVVFGKKKSDLKIKKNKI